MWDCESCGTQAIAGDLVRCPGCGKDRAQPVSESGTPVEVGQDAHELTDPATRELVTGGAQLIGERGPEMWDRSKSVAQNLAEDPVLKGEPGPELTDLPEPRVATPPPADEVDSDG